MPNQTLEAIVSLYGKSTKEKLSNLGAKGEPEDQLRGPIDRLIIELSEFGGHSSGSVVAVGETVLEGMQTRPDFSVTVKSLLTGYIELKAPGKGADPRRFKDKHDKEQWEKLKVLPNLIYSDGNEFSLWRSGQLEGEIVRLQGDVAKSGVALKASPDLSNLVAEFLNWKPIPPKSASQLAQTSARLCHLLRDEVLEQLSRGNKSLLGLRTGWQKMLFPDASDQQFADGYAQAVTFGLLVARAKSISLKDGVEAAAKKLGTQHSLIGAALSVLSAEVEREKSLQTSINTMTRVFDVVDWKAIGKGDADVWLYFYEDFLATYDQDLRKKTGSYYTPPEVVNAMVRIVDEILKSKQRFKLPAGIADPSVTTADPAVGTGTFILGVLRQIAKSVEQSYGEGAVADAVLAALKRTIAFEMQLGPFAVAQLRIFAEVEALTGKLPGEELRMYVTNTLGNPFVEEEWLPNVMNEIAESRKKANEIKKNEPIQVVIGNPPYKEKAMGLGAWVESGSAQGAAILKDWQPPKEWKVSAHAKHLRNLYVYFWRWATWKVFDRHPDQHQGIVCFITVAGFLNGPGFQKMRDYLRRKANDIWVIDCSPEGHQPEVNTRVFQGVQQPVCIVVASRTKVQEDTPAIVQYHTLAKGPREQKFAELGRVSIADKGWIECPSDWRAPFLPVGGDLWSSFVPLDHLFGYNGSGVMPGRTWVIAPDQESLRERWTQLQSASDSEKEHLFHPHEGGDRNVKRVVARGLHGHEARVVSVAADKKPLVAPARYAFRSFDRQWIIPDNRVINRPNPTLWNWHSDKQMYLTALERVSPKDGPAVTLCSNIPDLDHYKGSFGGRAFPLYADDRGATTNISISVLQALSAAFDSETTAEELFAYLAAVLANPAFTNRFQGDLTTPGIRVPLTSDATLFAEAVKLGRQVLWLHTYGERFEDANDGRPFGAPRVPHGKAPGVPKAGQIPSTPMPDDLRYDEHTMRLYVGTGYVENVLPAVWDYRVSGKEVVKHWFSYRKANRERPIIGDRRPPSPLSDVQPDHWLSEYTNDLVDLLNVLTLLVELEPQQAKLLDRICAGPLLEQSSVQPAGKEKTPSSPRSSKSRSAHPSIDGLE